MVKILPEHIATGGNRHPAVADWDCNGSGLLAYGADRNIAVWNPYDPDHRGVCALLCGHTDTVNAVKFLKPVNPAHPNVVIVSGSADHTLRVWIDDSKSPNGFKEVAVVEEHGSSINAIAVLSGSNTVISSSADAQVKVWRLEVNGEQPHAELKLLQTIFLKPHYFPLALDLVSLESHGSLVLAVAGTKFLVQLFVAQTSENPTFKPAATLTGHDGWIRSLAFVREEDNPGGNLILASASQDKYIRLWRIHKGEPSFSNDQLSQDPLLSTSKNSLSNKAHRFTCGDLTYSVTFEALLIGHEDWIYTGKWNYGKEKGLRLLSASADNSLAIWEPDPSSGVWICTARLGEINAAKGATTATGSAGGFWIGLWAPDGNGVMSLGRTGSWRRWRYDKESDGWISDVGVTGHTGSVRALTWARDGSYLLSTGSDQTTRLLSQWQTSRSSEEGGNASWHECSRPQVHGYDLNCVDVLTDSKFISGADEKPLRVFEKPKAVSGLLNSLLGRSGSGSNKNELPSAASIPVMGLSNKAIDTSAMSADDQDLDFQAVGKDQVEEAANSAATQITLSSLSASQQPPLEDHLGRHLLWPETEKLYGHGYEICAVACSHDGKIVATACRASSIDHAVIRLYETEGWREINRPLKAHGLTVTALEFDRGDEFLLSVGRDRRCVVWVRDAEDKNKLLMLQQVEKAHTRMILDASWANTIEATAGLRSGANSGSTSEQRIFATAGRDKSVHIWSLNANPSLQPGTAGNPQDEGSHPNEGSEELPREHFLITRITTLTAATAVTAVAFAPQPSFQLARADSNADDTEYGQPRHQQNLYLAFGLEDGNVGIARLSHTQTTSVEADHVSQTGSVNSGHANQTSGALQVVEVPYLDRRITPSKAVNALAWRPAQLPTDHGERDKDGGQCAPGTSRMKLAAASEDSSVIIYDVRTSLLEEKVPLLNTATWG